MKRTKKGKPERIFSEEKAIRAYAIRPRPSAAVQDGRWYWQFVQFIGGKRVSAHPSGWFTRDEAMRVVLQWTPKATRQITRVTTVDHLLRVWVLSRKQAVNAGEIRPSSYKVYRLAQKRLSKLGESVLLSRLYEPQLMMLRRQLRAQYSDRTTRQTMDILRAAWAWGQTQGHTEFRPLPKLRWPDQPEAVYNTHCPTSEDAARVYEQICLSLTFKGRKRPRQGQRTRLLYLATWMLGCREEELCNLTWGQLDLEAATITLHRKGRRGRKKVQSLELAPKLVAELANYKPEGATPGARVFSGATPKAVHTTLWGNIKRACQAAEVEEFTPHGLRRLASTILYERLGPKEYEAWMGHTYKQGGDTYAKARATLLSPAPGLLGPGDLEASDVIPFRPAKRR